MPFITSLKRRSMCNSKQSRLASRALTRFSIPSEFDLDGFNIKSDILRRTVYAFDARNDLPWIGGLDL